MYKKICIFSIAAVFFSAISMPAKAEETLTLEKALSVAFERSPRMVEARKSIDVAKGDFITAKTLSNPEAEFEIGGLKGSDDTERRGNLDSFEIRQGFDPPGVRGLKAKIARKEVTIQEELLKSVWSEVYLSVRSSYAKIVLDKKELELARTNLDIMRQFYGKVQTRFQSGQALKNDLQRAKVEVLRAENNFLSAEKELNVDRARLNLLLGYDFDVPFEVSEELSEESVEIDLKDITSTALSKRPDLKAENLNLEAKTSAVTKEQLNRLPSPFVGFQRTTEEYENDAAVVMGFSVPLWNLNQGEVKKAQAQKEAQTTKVEAVKRGVAFDVYEAYLNAGLAKKQLSLLKQSLEEASELLRLADLRYSEGEIDFINYLDQVRTVNETRVRYYEGLFNLNNTVNELERVAYASLRGEEFLK